MSIHISASLIEDYISCNRKVYYRIHRPDISIQNREMVIGDIVHHTLEKHSNDESKAYEVALREISLRVPNDKSALKFTEDCLQTFFHNFVAYLTSDDKIEQRFKIPYEDDVFIVGKMDRISNGCIFDWKTARKPLTDISGSVQFILYNWAYEKIYGREPSGVYYGALTNGSLVKYSRDEIAEKVLFSEIIPQVISSIKSKDYTPNGIFRKACFRCSYSDTCLEEIRTHVMDSSTSSKK